MNRLSIEDRVQILSVLSEGAGINAACRITGKSKNTVLKPLGDVGHACHVYQDRVMRDLKPSKIQVDEIWSFIGMKERNVTADSPANSGDVYTFTAIDPETKLMPCWYVARRTRENAEEFLSDLASRLSTRVQLTTDAWPSYPKAVEHAFGGNVDYAVLNKEYGHEPTTVEAKRRYSPAIVTGTSKTIINGDPDKKHISTSHVERANLSMRMGMRRFTRLTNAFSKKLENHMHAVSFYFMVYNFVRIHSTVKCSPAMAAGVESTLWDMRDIVMMAETMGSEEA
jgi:IS1 family transposase